MNDAVLSLNAGSSSLKFALFELGCELRSDRAVAHGSVSGIPHAPRAHIVDGAGTVLADLTPAEVTTHEQALTYLFAWIERECARRIVAVGHRVVHGGAHFVAPVRIDDGVVAQLTELTPLAPLQQPHNLAAIELLRRLRPQVPQVACFDTAFHHTQSRVATAFALPRGITEGGVRRYGFHGLSYEYIASELPSYLGERAGGRIVVAHLGSGASMCAMRDLRSVATTMGFSALDGLPMGTRCGAVDPGVLLYLLERGMTVAELRDTLWLRSGLLGVSGVSDDMRELLVADNTGAREAIALFAYRIVREVGSLAAALGGLDALVFTAGIGENAPDVRAAVCAALGWLGIALDPAANRVNARRISEATSPTTVCVIPTDEEAVVARNVVQALHL
jgi:acetate kinase